MKVLSLFDGIACGYEALVRAGKRPDVYFASEVDRQAIKVAKFRHPDIVHLGAVEQLTDELLFPHLDLIIGGSPCQGLSKLGNGTGLQHEGSRLFWDYVRLKNRLKPKNFLFENVQMSKADNAVVTEALGVEPVLFNSNLVSAQNRPRLYWTDIPFTLPRDRRIFFPNICEYDYPRLFKKPPGDKDLPLLQRFLQMDIPRPVSFMTRRSEEGRRVRSAGFRNKEGDVGKFTHREFMPHKFHKVSCILTSDSREHYVLDEVGDLRRMTIVERERAQTLPDNYTDVAGTLSESARIELIGNGWTVDAIVHIFSFL